MWPLSQALRICSPRPSLHVPHPSILHPSILHPSILHPSILHPSILHPSILHPSIFHPSILRPKLGTCHSDSAASGSNKQITIRVANRNYTVILNVVDIN